VEFFRDFALQLPKRNKISCFTGTLLPENLGAVKPSFSNFPKILETLPGKSRRRVMEERTPHKNN
jgi:hypothetical protein